MTVSAFKEKNGYEVGDSWFPRVTAIISSSGWSGLSGAAAWGTKMHEIIENILEGKEAHIDSRMILSVRAFQDWFEKHPFQVHHIEKLVHDVETGYAGTTDIIAEINGKVGVIDIKTSIAISRMYGLQTAAYVHAYNSNGPGLCETRWILRIDQYEECEGCFAKKREKYGLPRINEGNEMCNHQWGELRAEVECVELYDYEKDIDAFFAAKNRWELKHEELLNRIPNYAKNITQAELL